MSNKNLKIPMGLYAASMVLLLTGIIGSTYHLKKKFDETNAKLNKLEKKLDSLATEINERAKQRELSYYKELRIQAFDREEFPNIENFKVTAENLGIPRSELRGLQRYFKAYNNHVEQCTKKYPTNL